MLKVAAGCALSARINRTGVLRIVRIPRVRERVRIEGRDDVFLVVWLDLDREVVDLIPIAEGGALEESVPFRSIQSVADERS
jgi:hypothetical protein